MAPEEITSQATDAAVRSQERRSAVQIVVTSAITVATVVFYPYIFCGRMALSVTNYALHVPGRITGSIYSAWGKEAQVTPSEQSRLTDVNDVPPVEAEHAIKRVLLFPARTVVSGISAAASVPISVANYSGRKISGAITHSHAVVTRTSRNIYTGVSTRAHSTFSATTDRLSGVVRDSAFATGDASVSVVSYGIAIPAYHLLVSLSPSLASHVSQEDCVDQAKSSVRFLIRTLGPQNAFYIIKWAYDTAHSEELYDMLMLCRDITREAFDGNNYRRAGAAIQEKTNLYTGSSAHEAYDILPTKDEVEDVFQLFADISNEVISHVSELSAFGDIECEELLDDSSESEDSESSGHLHKIGHSIGFSHNDVVVVSSSKQPRIDSDMHDMFDASIDAVSRVLDNDHTADMFNAFGDFIDSLVD